MIERKLYNSSDLFQLCKTAKQQTSLAEEMEVGIFRDSQRFATFDELISAR